MFVQLFAPVWLASSPLAVGCRSGDVCASLTARIIPDRGAAAESSISSEVFVSDNTSTARLHPPGSWPWSVGVSGGITVAMAGPFLDRSFSLVSHARLNCSTRLGSFQVSARMRIMHAGRPSDGPIRGLVYMLRLVWNVRGRTLPACDPTR